MTENIRGYRMLAATICNLAIYDYKNALRKIKNKHLDLVEIKETQKKISDIENFLCSEWAEDLAEFAGAHFEPEKLINKLRSEVK